MGTALFINGIFDSVLAEILDAQIAQSGGESFLQPYKGQVISMLREQPPTPSSPVTLYISTTENLSKICYTAEIIKWEDKRELPERVQIISIGYRRNADVIVAVLNRANGICERCRKSAPFVRKSDGTPFLEVHHRKPLAEGGEDTTDNALALCPNCHREVHHG